MKFCGSRLTALAFAVTLAACGAKSKHTDAPRTPPPGNGSGSGDQTQGSGSGSHDSSGSGAAGAGHSGGGTEPDGAVNNGAGNNGAGNSGTGNNGAGSASGSGSGASDGSGSNVIVDASYAPKGGDINELSSQVKAWVSDAAEPEFSPAESSNTKVLALYKEGSRCRYRVESTSAAGATTAYDLGCEALTCSDSTCTSKDIADADVGPFKAAKGKEMTCQHEQGSGATRLLVKTVSQIWSHADALSEGHMVKSDGRSCVLTLSVGENAAGLDACAPPLGRTAQMSRSIMELTSQTRGAGTPDLTLEPTFKFTVAGSFAEPAGAKIQQVSCSLAADKLTVMMTKSACDANKQPIMYSAMFMGLPKELGTDIASSPYGAYFSAGTSSYLAAHAGACRYSLEASGDPKMVKGTATCESDAFVSSQPAGKVSLTDIAFTCFAPEGL